MVNIDTVYQKVLALSNKERRGYITPQEFNLFADKAQREIAESYFHNIKTGFHKLKNNEESGDDIDILKEKLDYLRYSSKVNVQQWLPTGFGVYNDDQGENGPNDFMNDYSNYYDQSNQEWNLDADRYVYVDQDISYINLPNVLKIASMYLVSASYTIHNPAQQAIQQENLGQYTPTERRIPIFPHIPIEKVTREELNVMQRNFKTAPSIRRPVYCISSQYNDIGWLPQVDDNTPANLKVELYPTNTTPGMYSNNYWEMDITAGNAQANNDWTDFTRKIGINGFTANSIVMVDSWRTNIPNWGYVVVNGKALYNNNTSINFILHPLEEENLVARILELASISMQKPELYQTAMIDKRNTKQELND